MHARTRTRQFHRKRPAQSSQPHLDSAIALVESRSLRDFCPRRNLRCPMSHTRRQSVFFVLVYDVFGCALELWCRLTILLRKLALSGMLTRVCARSSSVRDSKLKRLLRHVVDCGGAPAPKGVSALRSLFLRFSMSSYLSLVTFQFLGAWLISR